MARRPSITYWNRVEPSPRADSLQRGLEAAVRDPLWFLTRQWQLGEFQGEDAASPAFTAVTARVTPVDGWRPDDGAMRPVDAPLEPLAQNEAVTPDLRTAVELGQTLEARLAVEGASPAAVNAFRAAHPVPGPAHLSAAQRRDRNLVRLVRVCGGRATDGLAALAAAPALPPGLDPGDQGPTQVALAWLAGWVEATLGPVGLADAEGWRPERLEYGLEVAATTPNGAAVTLTGETGPFGELDWYAFDETGRTSPPAPPPEPETVQASLLPARVTFPGMPDPRWWKLEDARFNWAAVDTDRRDLGKVMVMDFMLVQGNDWFVLPFGQRVGTLAGVDQLLVRDVFGEWTAVDRADAAPGEGRRRWTIFSTTADGTQAGLGDYFLLPPGALRATLDGPDLEEVRFVRDEQANMAWAVEAITEDASGRPWPGRERALEVPDETPEPPPTTAPLRYRLQTTVPVNWIPLLPVQVDEARREVALERAAMQRFADGVLASVAPAGRVMRPPGVGVYRIREEEIARTGARVVRADRRARWTDGSTHLWTSRRRRAGMGEAASGLRYDLADPTQP